jgi:membrane associated rhomboid family serine protease
MLLIPIAQEENTVRRTPWVSFVLIGLCFLAFVASDVANDAEHEWERRVSTFLDYLGQHPYLTPSPQMTELLSDGLEEARAQLQAQWESAGGTVDEETARREQAELDGLADEALAALHSTPTFRLGFVPAAPGPVTALTSMFMHAGWLHLLGNMLFLFLTGPFIEDRYGRAIFGGFYVLSGFAALLAHTAHNPGSPIPLVGASGAIAGVMGAFLVRLGRARIRFLFLPIPILWMFRFQVVLPAFVVLPLWLLEQVFYAQVAPSAGVAWWAHIGGFVAGVLFALALKLFSVEENYIHPAIEQEVGIAQDPRLEKAMDARLAGDFATARRELRAVLAAQPDNLDAWRESYETALEGADAPEVARAGERVLGLAQRLRESALAGEVARDPRWREMEAVPLRLRLAVAAFFERQGDGRSALDEYEEIVGRAPEDPAALRALVRRAEILKQGGDHKRAREALLQARTHPACRDAWPGLIEKGLRELPT